VNAHADTSKGEMVCNRLAASFTGRHEKRARHVLSVPRPHTTKGVLSRVRVGSSPGARSCDSGLQVEAVRPVTERAVSCSRGLEPRDGACKRHRNVRGGSASGKGSSSPCKARRVRHRDSSKRRRLDASERIHRSWRQRIAASRLVSWIPPARTVRGPERTTPLSRCARFQTAACTAAPCEVCNRPSLNPSATTSRYRSPRHLLLERDRRFALGREQVRRQM
jgi:hypothetical protein